MTQEEVARRGKYRSRLTVHRWEQGDLPVKNTPRARGRWLRIIQSYGLDREEADEILNILGLNCLKMKSGGNSGSLYHAILHQMMNMAT
jgi:hypothetical protein